MSAKFLVIWKLEVSRLGPDMLRALIRQQDHARDLQRRGTLEHRYHVVGGHGGAWIYSVDSHEELDRLLAMSPAFNFATYQVIALAEMVDDPEREAAVAD